MTGWLQTKSSFETVMIKDCKLIVFLVDFRWVLAEGTCKVTLFVTCMLTEGTEPKRKD